MRRSLLHTNQKICRYCLKNCSSCRIFNHENTIYRGCRSLLSRRGGRLAWCHVSSQQLSPSPITIADDAVSRYHDMDRGSIFWAVIRFVSCLTVCVVRLLSLRLWAISLWRISEIRKSGQHVDVMVIVNFIPAPLMHTLLTLQPNTSLKMCVSKGSEYESVSMVWMHDGREVFKPKSLRVFSRAARLAQRMLSHPYYKRALCGIVIVTRVRLYTCVRGLCWCICVSNSICVPSSWNTSITVQNEEQEEKRQQHVFLYRIFQTIDVSEQNCWWFRSRQICVHGSEGKSSIIVHQGFSRIMLLHWWKTSQ